MKLQRFMSDEQIENLKKIIAEGKVKDPKQALELLEFALVNKVVVCLNVI